MDILFMVLDGLFWWTSPTTIAAVTGLIVASEVLRSRRVIDVVFGFIVQVEQALSKMLARDTKIYRAPGTRLERVLRFAFRKKTFDTLYGQTIADAREEYFQALSENHLWEARWITGCLYINILKVLIVGFGVSLARKAVEIWKIGN